MKMEKKPTGVEGKDVINSLKSRKEEVAELCVDGEIVPWRVSVEFQELYAGDHWLYISGGVICHVRVFDESNNSSCRKGKRTHAEVFDENGRRSKEYTNIRGREGGTLRQLTTDFPGDQALRLKGRPSWVDQDDTMPTKDDLMREAFYLLPMHVRKNQLDAAKVLSKEI